VFQRIVVAGADVYTILRMSLQNAAAASAEAWPMKWFGFRWKSYLG
jgi:hypothetical protein